MPLSKSMHLLKQKKHMGRGLHNPAVNPVMWEVIACLVEPHTNTCQKWTSRLPFKWHFVQQSSPGTKTFSTNWPNPLCHHRLCI